MWPGDEAIGWFHTEVTVGQITLKTEKSLVSMDNVQTFVKT